MKSFNFAKRNFKEMLREPLLFLFALGFPLVLLALMTVINSNIPIDLFSINKLSPGIVVFGLSFISLFSGTLIASDRSSSFLTRLFSMPMKAWDFILGYILPAFLLSVFQVIICFTASVFCGLEFSVNILWAIIISLPTALMFISIGLCLGCLVNENAVGGLSSVIVNLAAWLSGVWFDVKLVSGFFEKICASLPFIHAKNSVEIVLKGQTEGLLDEVLWVLGYALLFTLIAVWLFRRKMKE